MKFSEAIRLGAMDTQPARGVLSRRRRKYLFFGPVVGETCALGAAYHAIGRSGGTLKTADADSRAFRGVIKKGELYTEMDTPPEWNPILSTCSTCPVCSRAQGAAVWYEVKQLIPHLNDDHQWTREAIAAWVEQFESADVAAPALVEQEA